MDALKQIVTDCTKAELPKIEIGDTVKVHVWIKEGEKKRVQVFEGTVIAKKHGGISETFTVRRVAHGCGVERVFPIHSPNIDRWSWSGTDASAAASSTTCVTVSARPPRSRTPFDKNAFERDVKTSLSVLSGHAPDKTPLKKGGAHEGDEGARPQAAAIRFPLVQPAGGPAGWGRENVPFLFPLLRPRPGRRRPP